MSDTTFHAGSVLSVEEQYEGQYNITQVEQRSQFPGANSDDRVDINWAFGPYKAEGYVNTSTLEIGLVTHVVGHSTSAVYGNLKDGLGLSYNLLSAKGSSKWYLKNGNEVWVHLDIKVVFDGSFNKDYKVLAF